MLARRAERLLRWYPSEWRARYGDEFAELLISDMSEQPRSLKRPVDVAVSGVVARLAYAGLNQSNLEHSERTRRTLLAFACAAAVFVTFGLGMWAQLTIGWQWSAPDTVATSAAMVVMSCSVLVLLSLGALAVVPLAWTSARSALRRGRVLRPFAPRGGWLRDLHPRKPPFRKRLARNRWSSLGASGSRPRRSGCLRMGSNTLRHGVLGASGEPALVPGPRACVDGGRPDRPDLLRRRGCPVGAGDGALAQAAAFRSTSRPARRRGHGHVSDRGESVGRRWRARTTESLPCRRHRHRQHLCDGGLARHCWTSSAADWP